MTELLSPWAIGFAFALVLYGAQWLSTWRRR